MSAARGWHVFVCCLSLAPSAYAQETPELDEPAAEEQAPVEETPADELDAPEAEEGASEEWIDPGDSPALATETAAAVPSANVETGPPRGWRYSHRAIDRPLSLPQGLLRFDSTVAVSDFAYTFTAPTFGGTVAASGFFGVAAGIFDELEIGLTPLALTFLPPFTFADPSIYARARPIFGTEVQLAFRAGTTLPFTNEPQVAQLELGVELAWRPVSFFRLDAAIDYALLFLSPLQQRVGIPVRATFQADANAFGLTIGVFVFNDFDDVDVPLLVSYAVSFVGRQGPLMEASLEGGFLDLERASQSLTIRTRLSFFLYI